MSASRRQKDLHAKAAEWVVRLGGGPLREDERRRLADWLAKSPAHKSAFDRARSTWSELAQLKTAPGSLPNAAVGGRRSWGRATIARAASVVAVALIGAILFWFGNPVVILTTDYRTSPGESRTVTLTDGSVVQLDTASALAVHFNGSERRVVLVSGEAYFNVAPMREAETRPFVVEAANGTARALGTQFMVERQEDGAEVTVAEHKVRVAVTEPEAGRVATMELSPGQSVHYDQTFGLGAVTQVNVGEVMAWRQGRLVFDKVPLADVVAALNRYRRGRIVIADTSLADRRVSGVFDTASLESALDSIARELGVRTASARPFVTLLY